MNERELRLMRSLRDRLQNIEQEIRSIRDSQERQEHQRDIQPVWINPILAKHNEAEANSATYHKKNYSVQNSLRWATWCAFVAAAVYAGIAALQKNTMDKTLTESRHITELTKKSLRAVSAGIVASGVGFTQGAGVVNVTFQNVGKGNVWNLRGSYKIIRESIPAERLIWTSETQTVTHRILIPNQGPNNFTILPSYAKSDLDKFTKFAEGVKVSGEFSYNDGFEDIGSEQFCWIAINANTIPCNELPIRLRINSDPFCLNVPTSEHCKQ
jgi:hypothetical protein